MASELRNQILKADDIGKEIVEVPEWGVKVEIRGMNGLARAKFLKASAGPDGAGTVDFERFFPDLIIACAFDPETGEQVFDLADREVLNEKSGAALQRLADPAMRLSGLAPESLKEAEADLGEVPRSDST
jgi:hypothetical protein